jgi:PIN domain nuclease of toxin-antitoxin system
MLISDLSTADRLVMDTHVWLWAAGEADGEGLLKKTALQAIEAAARARSLFVSAASVWEIALKAQTGWTLVSGDLNTWVRDQQAYPGVDVIPIGSRLAIDSTLLPPWIRKNDAKEHRDPNDRFIVTTARRLNAVLLTCDEQMIEYAKQGHVNAFDACR